MNNTSTKLSTRKRSVGVTVIGIFSIILALCIQYVCTVFFIDICPKPFTGSISQFHLIEAFFLIIIPALFNVGLIGIAIFLIKRRDWARRLLIAIYPCLSLPLISLAVFVHVPGSVVTPEQQLTANITSLFLSPTILLILWSCFYLTRPKVKEQFQSTTQTTTQNK